VPEFTNPGVYVEESSRGPNAINGVGTSTTAFIGPTIRGPVGAPSEPLTSLVDFERVYGGSARLRFVDGEGRTGEIENYVWHAARGFFAQQGERLYVTRVQDGDRRPLAAAYTDGLARLETLKDVSIVAAPGSTYGYESGFAPRAREIVDQLLSHVERTRYRFAILDSGDGQSIARVREMRGRLDSTRAALYYPWVRVADPTSQQAVDVPPSGIVAGIYARNDVERGVHKAPANVEVKLALAFERSLNSSQQATLNAGGINCFRSLEGRGLLLWGARTISSAPEWKYVNIRRYLTYLEQSIEGGTQWVVFEPNDERLWAQVRHLIESFLHREWRKGALVGDTPEKAYLARCDRTTMSQNDIDNGRLVCTIGVAPVHPAEFMIFRIGQWTASARA
jgi:phage tail sheath protein FI